MGVRHMKISKGRSMIITGMKEEFQQNKCCWPHIQTIDRQSKQKESGINNVKARKC
jgi:hypothetical protein